MWFSFWMVEVDTKDSWKMGWKMEMVSYNLMMEAIMLANGKITKCMALESCTIKMGRLLMKEIGITINFAVLEECLMTGLRSLLASSIITISLI